MKKMTPLTARLYELALGHGLDNPLGRALYVTNRHYNTGSVGVGDLEDLTHTQPETAERWLKHWMNGGSLKALKYTAAEWNAHRAATRWREPRLTPEQKKERRAIVTQLRAAGFKKESSGTYAREDGTLRLVVEMRRPKWRVVRFGFESNTVPSYFSTAAGCARALTFESARTDEPKNVAHEFA